MKRLEELKKICKKLDEDKQLAIIPLLTEIVFMETRLEELRKLPHIKIHPNDPTKQAITPAGKQYKETVQGYLNALKVLMTALYRVESSAADELLSKLKEFDL